MHLDVDPTIRPSKVSLRRISIAVAGKLEAKLDRLTVEGGILKVIEPMDWVSTLVVAKNGQETFTSALICSPSTRR